LQSENYNIKRFELDCIYRKGQEVAVPTASVDLVANPDVKDAAR
jgi:hypothetical protein